MRRTSAGIYRHRKVSPAVSSYQSSHSRYLRAFASARAMRFWRPRVAGRVLGVAAFVAALAPSAAQAQFPASFDLSTLDGTNGFVINGVDVFDYSAGSVSGAGDVNGDGIDDLIIGARAADPDGRSYAGESYVVFGRSSGGSPSLDLGALNGPNGFVINGADAGDLSGVSVSGAGDINGDGFDDLIIGAKNPDPNGNLSAGESYVVFGNSGGFLPSFNLSTLNGSNGFVINGVDTRDYSGSSVSGVGDINGDGIDDLIIGASSADPSGNASAGESYVVFGSVGAFSPSLDLSTLDGSNGFVINGVDAGDGSGRPVSGAGDINGDGFEDLIIGASAADPGGSTLAGESYVVFGNGGAFSASIDLSALDGTNGFVINGLDAGDNSGSSVSGAGDINGDGIDDLLIGANWADPNGNRSAGKSYVVFGQINGFSSSFDLNTLDGTNGFVINGVDAFDNNGSSVSGAGDVNGDGIDDLLIGASDANPNGNIYAGETYVVFGRAVSSGVVKGDVDMDGVVDFADIPAFISVLQAGGFQSEADCDCSTIVDMEDIPAFIALLQQQ